jgi:hypothetical protein
LVIPEVIKEDPLMGLAESIANSMGAFKLQEKPKEEQKMNLE